MQGADAMASGVWLVLCVENVVYWHRVTMISFTKAFIKENSSRGDIVLVADRREHRQ